MPERQIEATRTLKQNKTKKANRIKIWVSSTTARDKLLFRDVLEIKEASISSVQLFVVVVLCVQLELYSYCIIVIFLL